jgi:hypothetical protein
MGRARGVVSLAIATVLAGACAGGGATASAPSTTAPEPTERDHHDEGVDPELLLPAFLGAARFQDVAAAEAAGWVSTIDSLGCFESAGPPRLFGLELHEHPVLPFWILHAYLWKDNPSGMFSDWNPAVRPCPDGVGVFGVDLPPTGSATESAADVERARVRPRSEPPARRRGTAWPTAGPR